MEHFIEREKELFKLNAKLNARTKNAQALTSVKIQSKPVQIHTANNYFNYYEDQSFSSQNESQDEGLHLTCKKINIANQPIKKPQEVVYPLFVRHTTKNHKETTLDIHIRMPTGSVINKECGQEEVDSKSADFESETIEMSFKNESIMTRYSDDSSPIARAELVPSLRIPSLTNDFIPKTIENKDISKDGLLK